MNKRQAKATAKHLEAQKKLHDKVSLKIALDNASAAERTRKIEAEMYARWAAEDAAKAQNS